MDLKAFGLALAKERMKKGLSQYELSLQVDKAENYINRVESGDVNISLKSLFAICQKLEIEPADLLKKS